MTDNFNIIKDYMRNLGIVDNSEAALKTDLFFDVQLIRRGKDHPFLPAANYTFKTYYFDNLDGFDKSVDEIRKCCDMFGLRAYVSVNEKSKQEALKKTLERNAHNVVLGEYRKPWKDFSSVCGGLEGKEKRWIVDIDMLDGCNGYIGKTRMNAFNEYIEKVRSAIGQCESSYDNPIVTTIPTRSGQHIITHPFNLQKFNTLCKQMDITIPDIKKNHITLLYENLSYGLQGRNRRTD